MIKLVLVCVIVVAGVILFSGEIADVFYKSAETLNSTEFAEIRESVMSNVSSISIENVGRSIDEVSDLATDTAADLQETVTGAMSDTGS